MAAATARGRAGRSPAPAPCDTGEVTSVPPLTEQVADVDEPSPRRRPWVTIVWNDPVNLMSYVTLRLPEAARPSRDPKAEKLMLDVHHKGRATVSSGTREKMEADVAKLQGAGLWATMAEDRWRARASLPPAVRPATRRPSNPSRHR